MFAYTVASVNDSGGQGVEVVANTLELNGGTVKSTSSGVAANLAHTGLAADTEPQGGAGDGEHDGADGCRARR